MKKFYFAHRPPTTGVHLLSDPWPDFGGGTPINPPIAKLSETAKRSAPPAKPKKPRSRG